MKGWRGDLRKMRNRLVAEKTVVGHTLSQAGTLETILSPADGNRLAVVYVVAWQDASGSVDVRLRDSGSGNGPLVSASIDRTRPAPLIESAVGLVLDGGLQAEVGDTAVTLSAWALEVAE